MASGDLSSCEFGPSLPPWWKITKTVPDARLSSRWEGEEDDRVFAAFAIPWQLLEHWAKYGSNGFVASINYLIAGKYPLRVKDDNERVEKELSSRAEKVRRSIVQASGGRKQAELRARIYKLHLQARDFVDCHSLLSHNINLEKRLEELDADAVSLLAEMSEELEMEKAKVATLEEENRALHEAVEKFLFRKQMGVAKTLGESGERSARYKLTTLKSRAQLALAFARKLGVTVESLILRDDETRRQSQVLLHDHGSKLDGISTATQVYVTKSVPAPKVVHAPRLENELVSREEQSGKNEHFNRLTQQKKEQVYGILQILDRFCVSDEAYHEITMHPDGTFLPRSYIVKQARHDLNELCQVELVNEDGVIGARLPFADMLRAEISLYQKENKVSVPDTMKIKIGGDGAEMSRSTSFQMFGFSLINWGNSILQPSAVRTAAVMSGPETYETLRDGMGSIFNEVNYLISAKQIEVDGNVVPLKFYLAGDTKYKQRLLGLMGSTSNYACPTCRVHKDKRWEMSHEEQFYESTEMRRNFQEDWKDGSFCHRLRPLIDIDASDVIIDELHLLLRITDVLTDNLLAEAQEMDCEAGGSGDANGTHMQDIAAAIRSCGVSFKVWQSKEQGKTLAYTSLMGSDKKILLRDLPSKLGPLLHADTSSATVWLWKEFYSLFLYLSAWKPNVNDIDAFHRRAKQWVTNFVKLGAFRPGYGREFVTPYMHSLVYHVAAQLRIHESLKGFSCQAIEKKNDFARRIVHHHSNKRNAMADVLLSSERQVLQSPFARTPRPYQHRGEGDHESVATHNLQECPVEWPALLDQMPQTPTGAAATAAEDSSTSAALEEAASDPLLAKGVTAKAIKRRSGQGRGGKRKSTAK